MDFKRVKFIIDSGMEHVPLIGMSVNRLCLSASFSAMDAFNIELCVVEAVTNSIRHSYGGKGGQEVHVVFTLTDEEVILDICDTGPPMNSDILEKAKIDCPENSYDLESISEGGRGLGIMKEIMDSVAYRTEGGQNCLTLKKRRRR